MDSLKKDLDSDIKLYVAILSIIIMAVGTIGNLLTIVVLLLYKKFQEQAINIILASISFCSFILDVYIVPVFAIAVLQSWPKWVLQNGMCNATNFIWNVCISEVVQCLLLLSFIEYCRVKKKFYHKIVVCIWLMSTWVISVCGHALESFNTGIHLSGNFSKCGEISGLVLLRSNSNFYVTLLRMVLAFIALCLFGMSTIHLRALKTYNKNNSNSSAVRALKNSRNQLKLVTIIFCLCTLCWLADWILSIAKVSNANIKPKLNIISKVLSNLSTTIVPITCTIFWKHYRRSVRDFFRGCKGSCIKKREVQKQDSFKLPLTRNSISNTDIANLLTNFKKGKYTTGSKSEQATLCDSGIYSGKRNLSFDGEDGLNKPF